MAKRENVKVSRLKNAFNNHENYVDTTQKFCTTCKGKCWKGINNNAETQKAAQEMFGIVPNRCVISIKDGHPESKCPYS